MRRCDKTSQQFAALAGELCDYGSETAAVDNRHAGERRNVRLDYDLGRRD